MPTVQATWRHHCSGKSLEITQIECHHYHHLQAGSHSSKQTHLWAIQGITKGRQPGKDLGHSLIGWVDIQVAALEQQEALHRQEQ